MKKLNLTEIQGSANVQSVVMAQSINTLAAKVDEIIEFMESMYGARQAAKPPGIAGNTAGGSVLAETKPLSPTALVGTPLKAKIEEPKGV